MTASDSARAGTEEGVVVERTFDAPRELVWRAWTEAEHFKRWYGPAGISATTCEIDFRVGGRYLFGLGMPDGGTYWNAGEYREITPPERFVATMVLSDEHGNTVSPADMGMPEGMPTETILSVTLEDLEGGRTKMTMRQAGWADESMAAGAAGGWNQAFDKLAAALAEA